MPTLFLKLNVQNQGNLHSIEHSSNLISRLVMVSNLKLFCTRLYILQNIAVLINIFKLFSSGSSTSGSG